MSDAIIERLNSRIVELEAKGECPLVVAELRDYKRHITALELGLAAAEQCKAVLREACDLLQMVALPPVGVSGRVAVNSSSDISSDEEREWAELEKLGPRGTDLIKFAKLNLPPQEWYDEVEGIGGKSEVTTRRCGVDSDTRN